MTGRAAASHLARQRAHDGQRRHVQRDARALRQLALLQLGAAADDVARAARRLDDEALVVQLAQHLADNLAHALERLQVVLLRGRRNEEEPPAAQCARDVESRVLGVLRGGELARESKEVSSDAREVSTRAPSCRTARGSAHVAGGRAEAHNAQHSTSRGAARGTGGGSGGEDARRARSRGARLA